MTVEPGRISRGRRLGVGALVVIATVVAVAAIFAVWADRQLLDADNWAETSTELLADDDIRTAVADFAVEEVYLNVDVDAELAQALPPRLQPLAGPAASGLRSLAERATAEALERPRVQAVWSAANRAAAQQFINVAEGGSGAVSASGNAVVLDLGVLLRDIVARLGLPGRVVGRIPPGAGRITVLSGDEVRTLQNAATAIDGFATVLPALAIALLALAVWLARGFRRRTLLAAGWALVAAGAIVLVGRKLAGPEIVDAVAPTEAVRPAAESAWWIGTGLLRDVAQACVIGGIPVIVAAWLAGPTRVAVALRRAAAPWLRERPGLAYGTGAALGLLAVAWGPIPATRQPLPVLLMFVLLMAGVAALRAQTAREFPDASVSGAQEALRERTERIGAALRGAGRTGGARGGAATAGAAGGGAGAATGRADDQVALLERLAALHDRGALTDEEFTAEKDAVLHGDGART